MTAAELLWRAVNVEPVKSSTGWDRTIWRDWDWARLTFIASHPADQIAYFEGLVRAEGWRVSVMEQAEDWCVRLDLPQTAPFKPEDWKVVRSRAPTEHCARLIAAARALNALGRITDAELQEVENADAA